MTGPAAAPGRRWRAAAWSPLTAGTALLAVAAVVMAGAAGRAAGAPDRLWWHVPAAALLLLVAAGPGVRFWLHGEGNRLDLLEVGVAVALLAVPGPGLLALVVAVKAATLLAQRVPARKVAFNLAQRGCSAAAGSLLLAVLRRPGPGRVGDLLPLAAALALVLLVNAVAVTLVLLAVRGAPARQAAPAVRAPVAALWLNAAVNLVLGVAAAALWVARPGAWPVLLLLLAGGHAAAQQWARRQAAQARLSGTRRAAGVLAAARDLDAAAGTFLVDLADAFECAGAELHLRSGPGGGPRHWSARGAPAGSEALIAALLEGGRAVRLPSPAHPDLAGLLAASGWRSVLAVPLLPDGTCAGVLLTHDRQGWEGFESSELEVLEATGQVLTQALLRERLGQVAVASETRFRAMVQHAPDLVLVVDADLRISYASPAAGQVLGVAGETLPRSALLDLVGPDDRARVGELLAWVRSHPGQPGRAEFRSLPARRDIEAVASALGDGSSGELVLNARDVTARRRAERQLTDQAAVLELVAQGAELDTTLGVLTGGLHELSGSACAVVIGPYDCPTVHGLHDLPEAARDDLAALAVAALPDRPGAATRTRTGTEVVRIDAGRSPALAGAGVTWVELRLMHTDETERWGAMALCHRHPPDAGSARALVGASHVAELALRAADVAGQLAHQAGHDPLTDLPNRSVFLDRVAQALRSSERTGRDVLVLFLDLDRFKNINDSLGHRAGDALLCEISHRLAGLVRPGDTVARFGGDEFTMLCGDITGEVHALAVVSRIREALAEPFQLGDREVFSTCSIGMVLGHGVARDAELLVEDADAAMYRAKEGGGNRVEMFDAALRQRAQHRLGLQSALHRALERDEFRVLYQPTVCLETGTVLGVEALVRWQRPGYGLVSPDEFIPLAEESGLIVPLGVFVLDAALEQAARWHRDGSAAGLSVAVNLSPRQLLDPELVDRVRAALQRTHLAPGGVTLEITESALLHDVPKSRRVLEELKGLGVRLFVDDFGTGYSSLSYLQRFPVDGVKVDRSFVSGMGDDPEAASIVRAVVGLGHSLGLAVVAEGVESAGEARLLRELDCEVGQGWYFGRPATAEQLPLGRRPLQLP